VGDAESYKEFFIGAKSRGTVTANRNAQDNTFDTRKWNSGYSVDAEERKYFRDLLYASKIPAGSFFSIALVFGCGGRAQQPRLKTSFRTDREAANRAGLTDSIGQPRRSGSSVPRIIPGLKKPGMLEISSFGNWRLSPGNSR